jgi:peptidoglycan/LPS O-acetylase OafA/YrhL
MAQKSESANLDLLRSLAVSLVLGDHVLVAFGVPWEGNAVDPHGVENPCWAAGHLGVLLFFIHTSLVLMMSLSRLEMAGGALARRFYIRRAFRIYPLSILAVLMVTSFGIPEMSRMGFRAPTATELWSNLVLVQNITGSRSLTSPLWSLPYEVQMYLALPFLYLLGKRVGNPLAVLAVGFGAWYLGHRMAVRLGMPPLLNYAPWFCMGVAAFFRRPERRLPTWLFVTTLASMVVAVLLMEQFVRAYWEGYLEWALGVGFCLTLPMFLELQWAPAKRVCHLIAKYSYGIYLAHLPILWFATEGLAGRPVALRAVLCVTMLIGVPVALYHTIEQPFIRLGARITTTHPQSVVPQRVAAGL